MINTFKSLIGNGKGGLRITNQIFSDEILSIKNATGCIFIEIVFDKCTFDRLNFESTTFSQCKFHKCRFLESNLNAAEIYQCKFDNSTLLSQISVIPKLVKPALIALNLKKPLSPKLILKIVIFKLLS